MPITTTHGGHGGPPTFTRLHVLTGSFRKRFLQSAGVLWLLLAACPAARAAPEPRISVAVAEDLEEVLLVPPASGETLRLLGADGEVLLESDSAMTLRPTRLGLEGGGKGFWRASILLRPGDSPVGVGKLLLGGEIEILKRAGRLTVINRLGFGEYLAGALAAEASPSWPLEALKAQAVVARTYALRRVRAAAKEAPFQIRGSVRNQVFRGSSVRAEGNAPLFEAVRQTRGVVARYEGEPIEAVYHSCCGGSTESSKNIWGEALPYLRGVSCEFCVAAPHYFWKAVIEPGRLLQALALTGVRGRELKRLGPVTRNDRDRARSVEVETERGGYTVAGQDFRGALGMEVVRSTRFKAKLRGERAWLVGSGFGHGVGMCQWGARGQAIKGRSYVEILKYYYPGIELKTVY